MVAARADLSVNEDVGIDGPHRSATAQQVEQLVAVQNVDAGLLGCVPPGKDQLVRNAFTAGKRTTQQLIREILQAAPFGRSLLFEATQDAFLEL